MSLHQQVIQQLKENLNHKNGGEINLNDSLRLLSKWRSVLIQNTILKQHGAVVLQGPFKGMGFINESAEGCHIAKILGCYEQPLQPFIEKAIDKNYKVILNIGCAEGYYAVGMAHAMKETMVHAYDISVKAQTVCAELAQQNGVLNRLKIGGHFGSEDFDLYKDTKTLVMCDIEGAERELLDPKISPAIKNMDIIVESHDCLVPETTKLLVERFNATHKITVVQDDGQRTLENTPGWFYTLAHLDQLLATWEWRSGPTPWLVMIAR